MQSLSLYMASITDWLSPFSKFLMCSSHKLPSYAKLRSLESLPAVELPQQGLGIT